MQPVLNFAALTASLKAKGRRWRVAVVCGTDRATLEALMRGTAEGFIEPWLFIPENFNLTNLPGEITANPFFHIRPADSDEAAARAAVAMAGRGEADLLMKGLIHTDTLPGDKASVAYATVYPLCMFLRVIIAQIIVMLWFA